MADTSAEATPEDRSKQRPPPVPYDPAYENRDTPQPPVPVG